MSLIPGAWTWSSPQIWLVMGSEMTDMILYYFISSHGDQDRGISAAFPTEENFPQTKELQNVPAFHEL